MCHRRKIPVNHYRRGLGELLGSHYYPQQTPSVAEGREAAFVTLEKRKKKKGRRVFSHTASRIKEGRGKLDTHSFTEERRGSPGREPMHNTFREQDRPSIKKRKNTGVVKLVIAGRENIHALLCEKKSSLKKKQQKGRGIDKESQIQGGQKQGKPNMVPPKTPAHGVKRGDGNKVQGKSGEGGETKQSQFNFGHGEKAKKKLGGYDFQRRW